VKIHRAYWLLIVVFLAGCAASKVEMPKPAEKTPGGEASATKNYTETKLNEDFDPLALRDDLIDPARIKSETAPVSDEKAEITMNSESAVTVFSENVPESRADSLRNMAGEETVPGWRIQICAIANETKAREILQQAEDVFEKFENLKVYFTYDSPYYKVRLGDCITRYQADRLLQVAMENGFNDAWVVKTNVFRQEDLFQQSEYPIETLQDSTESPKF